jgi:hypothetical protein
MLDKLVKAVGLSSENGEQKHIDAHHAKSSAHTGKPHPNMSTTFIGRSRADELECRQTPRSAEPTFQSY